MSLFHLAYSNVRENRRSYVSFFASFAFSVMVFYIFDAIATAPEIVAGGYEGAMALGVSLYVARWVIAVFSFFFTLYSNSAFLKMRKRDLGIMALLGATPHQVRSMLLLENTIIGLTSIVAGLFAGALLSRLIAMAALQMLRLDMPVPTGLAVNFHSIRRTALIYAAMFGIISLFNMASVRTSQAIQLVQAPKKPKSPPATSPVLSALAVACLVGGYYVAYTLAPGQVVDAMFPVTAVVCIGTYFLFTQVSVALLRRLSNRKGLYYRNINLITLSDLTFQMKDNARVLAAVTILSAIVLTSSGVVYSMGEIGLRGVQSYFVRSVSFALAGPDDAREVVDSYVQALEAGGVRLDEGVAVIAYLEIETEKIGNDDPDRKTAFLISEDDYNEWAERAGTPPIRIETGCAVELMPAWSGAEAGKMEAVPDNAIRIQRGGHETELTYCGHVPTDLRAANALNYRYPTWTSVIAVDSGDMQDIVGTVSDGGDGVIFSCDVENWKVADRAEKAAGMLLPEDRLTDYTSIISAYAEEKAGYGVTILCRG